MTITWTNERIPLRDLTPWERNPRTIKDENAKLLAQSVEDFGQVETLAIGPSGELYNGHQRLSVLAGQYGMDYEVDVRRASRALTEKERGRLTVYLHRGAAGEFDWTILADWDYTDLAAWGFTGDELDEHFAVGDGSEAGAGGDTEAQVDKAAELLEKWQVKTGDMFSMSAHRLICGDCTDAAVVGRLMGGERAEMVWTDPPYGVAVGDKNKYLNSIARSNRVEENLENDTLDEDGLMAMLRASFDLAIAHCTAGAAWYVAAPPGPLQACPASGAAGSLYQRPPLRRTCAATRARNDQMGIIFI